MTISIVLKKQVFEPIKCGKNPNVNFEPNKSCEGLKFDCIDCFLFNQNG